MPIVVLDHSTQILKFLLPKFVFANFVLTLGNRVMRVIEVDRVVGLVSCSGWVVRSVRVSGVVGVVKVAKWW